MKKLLFPLLVVGLFFYFHPAHASDVYFSQGQSNGYVFYDFSHNGHSYQDDNGSLVSFGAGNVVYAAVFNASNYPVATTSAASYVSDITLEIRDSNISENANYAVQFECRGDDGNLHGDFNSLPVNSSAFAGSFTAVDFQFSGPNCDLSKYKIRYVMLAYEGGSYQNSAQVRAQNIDSLAGYGAGNESILEDYEAQMVIKSANLPPRDPSAPCDSGYSQGGFSGQPIPTYSYGSDGLVEYHFSLDGGYNGDFFYRRMTPEFAYCVSSGPLVKAGRLFQNPLPAGTHLMLKAVFAGYDQFNQTVYNWNAFNDDTGEPIALDGPLNNTTGGYLSVGFYGDSGCPYCNNYTVEALFSPAVPILNPNPVSYKTPILIIPGVLGTDIKKGDDLLWANPKMARGLDGFMDPLGFNFDLSPIDGSLVSTDVIKKLTFNTGVANIKVYDYIDSLINQLTSTDIGYTEGKDLFTFPYDWRFGVSSNTVDQLAGQINYILTQTAAGKAVGKVNIVAHSTGGLLVKAYTIKYPLDHHIGKAIFVGVPNLGAPKALQVLTAGDSMGVIGLDPSEMKKLGQNMPVIYDLAPSEEYYNQNGSYFHIHNPLASLPSDKDKDLNFNDTWQSLINSGYANSQAVNSSTELHSSDFDNYDLRNEGIDLYSLVGCKSGTFGGLREFINKDSAPSFDSSKIISGDGTVPFTSAESLLVDATRTFFVPSTQHSSLLSADGSRQQIINLLTGSTLSTNGKVLTEGEVKNKPELCQIKGDTIFVKSPVDINATDQFGNFSGITLDSSVQNDIPGADYEVWGDHKYLFLPTGDGQVYSIALKGTGTGTFTFGDQFINGDSVTQTQIFSNLPVTPALTGVVNLGNVTTLMLLATPTSTLTTVSPSSIINSDASQDIVPPVSTSTISALGGQYGFYHSNATITLTAIDPIVNDNPAQTSGVLGIEYNLDNSGYAAYNSSTPLVISTEGQHIIKYFSTDRAGNNEEEQIISFVIDKTSPEIGVNFSLTTKDFVFSANDDLDGVLRPVCQNGQCTATDKAGNITVLKFSTLALSKNIKNLMLNSISYNSEIYTFDTNILAVIYTLSGNSIKAFTQTELIKNQEMLNISYTLKKNQSIITDHTLGNKAVVTTQSGLKVLQISSNQGKIKTAIK